MSNTSIKTVSSESVTEASRSEEQEVVAQIPEPGSLIASRLLATDKWLSEVDNNKYSIQLFLARAEGVEALSEFLSNVPESLDFNKIYIYETVIKNNPMHSVIYDDFSSYSEAVKVLNGLTDDFQISKPFIRRVSDLRPARNIQKISATDKPEAINTNVTLNNSVSR